MLWDKQAARATFTVLLILLGVSVAWAIRDILFLLVLALFFAYALQPLVRFVERFVKGPNARAWALAAVYLTLVVVILLVAVTAAVQFSEGLQQISQQAAGLLQRAESLTFMWPAWLEPHRDKILAFLQDRLTSSAGWLLKAVQSGGSQALGLLGNLIFLILIPIFAFLMLRDGGLFTRWLLDLMPEPERRDTIRSLLIEMNALLAGYMRALSLMSLSTFVAYWAFLGLVQMPYAFLLAALAGLLEFIPIVGSFGVAAVILLTAAATQFPHFWWIAAFLAAYRLTLDYVIMPYLMKEGVELHPLITIAGAMAGQHIGGVAGLFLSVPVLASLQVLIKTLRHRGILHLPVARRSPDDSILLGS
jgi:predicted PurR-regulated permease PerM